MGAPQLRTPNSPSIVFGWDDTPGLLSCTLDPDGRHVRLYRRVGGTTIVEVYEVP